MLTVPDPTDMPWARWAETLMLLNPQYSTQLHPGLPWDQFAGRLAQVEPLTPVSAGNSNWFDWAIALRSVFV